MLWFGLLQDRKAGKNAVILKVQKQVYLTNQNWQSSWDCKEALV